MNNEIEYLVSQMTPGQFNNFINQAYPNLVGNFIPQKGQTEQDKKRIVANNLIGAIESPAFDATPETVVGSLRKYVSPQAQQSRSANVNASPPAIPLGYSSFADDSYNATPAELQVLDEYSLLEAASKGNVSSRRIQPGAVTPPQSSQTPLDFVGIQNAITQDPSWQPKNDYERWALGFIRGEDTGANPELAVYNDEVEDRKAQERANKKAQSRSANANTQSPGRVGVRTDLLTGLVYDDNRNLVYDPTTNTTQKVLSGNRVVPTNLQVPNLIQETQEITPESITSGEGRFFGDAQFSRNRDNSVPYPRAMGVSPGVAQLNQGYSPEVMSRVGQGGFLNNAGSIMLPKSGADKESGEQVFSKGRGNATTIIYTNDGKGGVIPKISVPRVGLPGNDLIDLNDAAIRNIISARTGEEITLGTQNLITLGQLKSAKDIAAQTRFIPASGMDSFNRENVKLYEATDNQGKNYRATYMNPQTKEVYNVTQNGGFYLVRPGVSDEASGLPIRKKTTNLTQEMIGINQSMREGGRDNLVDVIREDPSTPGLEAFTRPVPAINPITGETINKYVHSGNSGRWVDDNNPEDLFSLFNANAESSGQSMEALDFARGGRRMAGVRKAPAYMGESPEIRFTDGSNRNIFRPGTTPGEGEYIDGTSEAGQFYLGINKEPYGNTGYANINATSSYPSLQETDYLGNRLAFNADGNVVDIPSQTPAAKGINNFTPASEFYSQSPQTVRDTRTGKIIYDPNRTVYVRTANTGFDDGDFAVVPYKEDKPVVSRVANINSPQSIVINDGKVVGKNAVVQREIFNNQEVYPGDFTNTKFYRFKTNPETPVAAYNVNEYGTPVLGDDGFPVELPIRLPRSAQIANNAEVITRPRLMVQDFKGVTPDYQPVPDGMSYEEANRKGLLNPVWNNSRPVGLNGSYQIPMPTGVGLARVLDEADPRTQAALAVQAEAQARIAADTTIVKPAFNRKYSITPGRTAGIESPQYAQYTDLNDEGGGYRYSSGDDSARFWKENIPGVVPEGTVDGAYLPVAVTPRPVNTEGKKGWLINDQVYTTESGREVRGDRAISYANVPLNLDNAATSYFPKSKREELIKKGFDDADIDAWVDANSNLARDNALANAKIKIDGEYYPLTPQATTPEFNPAAGGNYLQAVDRSEGRAARIDVPFKAGGNISEPTPEWIAEQAASGNLRFNADDYIRPEDRTILDQKEIYNAGYDEPTDILGGINRVQQRKNRVDAVISNREQRLRQERGVAGSQVMLPKNIGAETFLNKAVGSVVDGDYTTLSPGMKVFNQDMLVNPEDLSSPIAKNFVGPVQLIPDAQSPTRKTFKGWNRYSNYLAGEINRASAAQNTLINIEDAPEVIVTRTGNANQLERFVNNARALGLEDYNTVGDGQASMVGSLPNNLLPYEQAKELNQSRLLPAYRTQEKIKLPTVPTSNIGNLGRVPMPFPEQMTTPPITPPGIQVIDIAPSSSERVNVAANAQQPVQSPQVRTSGIPSPNIPIEPDVRMTGGMKIPKWAIPATLGAVWLGLAANARRQQEEERRQQQGVNVRY